MNINDADPVRKAVDRARLLAIHADTPLREAIDALVNIALAQSIAIKQVRAAVQP